ncbi:MAG: 16S rRNA (guanine(966)-N(2))-methyltransferase RsmD [Candidatus Omnitrophota bacterium]
MRIIAGKYRSRLIRSPRVEGVRPTKDRIREALFNIIREYIEGRDVLDLFAGSGAFGIEAISRGANKAVFVDSQRECIKAIEGNLNMLEVEKDRFGIIKMDVFKAVDSLIGAGKKFDIILMDPPYYKEMAKKCLIKLSERDILNPRCVIMAEHHKKDILPQEIGGITSYRSACYGDICLTFYKSKE